MSNEITPGKPIRIYQKDGQFNDFSTEDVVAKKLNSFLGWKCAAAVENICINFDGDILSASCGVAGPNAKKGAYGNVFTGFSLESDWITCTQKFCSCGADLFIPKAKSDDSKSLLQLKYPQENPVSLRRSESLESPAAIERTFSTQNKQVFWEIGRRCNYDCSYCHTYVHNNYEEHKTLEQLKQATNSLEEACQNQKINFAISGGEPTLNPDYLTWVKYLKERGHHISTHSNGSRNPDYYVNLIKCSDLNLSVHFEFYQKDKFIDVVTAVINELYLRRLALLFSGHFEIMIMTQPNQQDVALEFERELWRIPRFSEFCNLNLMPIRGHESINEKKTKTGDKLLEEYSEKELQKFGTKTQEMQALEIFSVNEDYFSKFDQLDGIKSSENRTQLFKTIK